MTQGRLSVVVIGVNYKTDAMAVRFVRSLSAVAKGAEVAIVLVNNSEGTDSSKLFNRILTENPDVLCIKPPTNLGYFGGARLGLNEHLGTGSEFPDWVIVSNVDVEFKDAGFFSHLRDVDPAGDVGVITPSICANSSLRTPNRGLIIRPRKRKMRFFRLVCQNFYVFSLYSLLATAKHAVLFLVDELLTTVRGWFVTPISGSDWSHRAAAEDDLKSIYAPHGACILFAKSYFLRGGTLDYPVFLFGEEIFVAETADKLELEVLYNPWLRVWHDDHASTGWVRSRIVSSYMREAAEFVADEYFQ